MDTNRQPAWHDKIEQWQASLRNSDIPGALALQREILALVPAQNRKNYYRMCGELYARPVESQVQGGKPQPYAEILLREARISLELALAECSEDQTLRNDLARAWLMGEPDPQAALRVLDEHQAEPTSDPSASYFETHRGEAYYALAMVLAGRVDEGMESLKRAYSPQSSKNLSGPACFPLILLARNGPPLPRHFIKDLFALIRGFKVYDPDHIAELEAFCLRKSV